MLILAFNSRLFFVLLLLLALSIWDFFLYLSRCVYLLLFFSHLFHKLTNVYILGH